MQHNFSRRRRTIPPMAEEDAETIDRFVETTLAELIDDTTLGVVFEIHRATRLGLLAIEDGECNPNFPAPPPPQSQYLLVDAPDLDVFGQPPLKKQHECVCPSCHRSLAASRFAPHLEKCMGMGRNSSRIASRRIANSSKEGSGGGSGTGGSSTSGQFVTGLLSDDDDDADWTMGTENKKRKRRDRHLGKRSKGTKVKNGGVSATGDVSLGATAGEGATLPVAPEQLGLSAAATVPLSYDSLNSTERRSLLIQMCGVVSEHTGKLCTRSLRCPQHTDDQRRNIRLSLLGPQLDQQALALEADGAEGEGGAMVDVDSYEDGDGQAVREALTRASSWEQGTENSGTSSPADSTSTSSSSSKKPTPNSKSKKSKSKSVKNTTPPNGYTGVPGPEESYTANSQR